MSDKKEMEQAREDKTAPEEFLRQTLEEQRRLAKDFEDRWLRARAELENFKKRSEKEKAEAMIYAQARVLNHLLSLLDQLGAIASELRKRETLDAKFKEGFDLLVRNLEKTLQLEGVLKIETQIGAPYDPHVHEVIKAEARQDSDGLIVLVLQEGYLLGGRVLRPARVIVSKKLSTKD